MTEHNTTGAPTWRELDREGCVYGRHTTEQVDKLADRFDECIKDIRAAQSKVTWALVGFAISFGTAALLLLVNLASKNIP